MIQGATPGSIATALASFNRLKREQAQDYRGGLLVIDELDVGFHPHAVERLAKGLKSYAKKLDLQVIATTHSPRLIEAVHPDGDGDRSAPDSVVYLLDTRHPRIAEDQSLQAILDDMALRQDLAEPITKPILGVYFEDLEGKQFFEALIPPAKRAALGRRYGVQIKPIALGVGGSNLIKLPEQDPVFKNRVLIVDADTLITQKASRRGNTLKLPCEKGASGTDRSPENTIKNFMHSLATSSVEKHREALLNLKINNPSSDKIISAFFSENPEENKGREASKKWWIKHWKKLKSWGILQAWIAYHDSQSNDFIQAFEAAVASTSTRLR